jgi:hypothetical protein
MSSRQKEPSSPVTIAAAQPLPDILSAERQRRFDVQCAFILLAFGAYQSVIFFGHQVVPNPDFSGFIQSARQFWSPGGIRAFTRAPVLGFLQIPLGNLAGGPHPDLTGGWLLNALVHPFNLLLLWLVGRKLIGQAALWVTLLAMLNPWVLYLVTEPICETLLLFFTLLTLHLIFRRSKWCYFFASVTSMVRFEGAALIFAALVLDFLYDRSRRNLLRVMLFTFLALIPLGLWLLAIKMVPGNTFYVENLSTVGLSNITTILETLCKVAFSPLFILPPAISSNVAEMAYSLMKILASAFFVFGVTYGLIKRKWEVLALLIFFVPYMVVHIMYKWSVPRFYASVHWIVLLICVLGLQGLWSLVNWKGRIPKLIVMALQAIAIAVAGIWAAGLLKYLPGMRNVCPPSNLIPLVTGIVLVWVFIVRRLAYGKVFAWRDTAVSVVVAAMVISNQFMLVRIVGDGQRNAEFKQLGDWYTKNAMPGDKMGLYMAGVVQIFAQKSPGSVSGLPFADNPLDFVKACYKANITHVVWASREGANYDPAGYYHQLNLDTTIAMLREPKNNGPYEYLKTIQNEKYRGAYLNIFRLHKIPALMEQK